MKEKAGAADCVGHAEANAAEGRDVVEVNAWKDVVGDVVTPGGTKVGKLGCNWLEPGWGGVPNPGK